MNIWRLTAHHIYPDKALEWTRQNGRIAIGWGKIGDISKLGCNSAREISAAIRKKYPELCNSRLGGLSLWNFYKFMKKGDLVILSTGKARKRVVEVQGDYEWTKEKLVLNGSVLSKDYNHQRRVRVSKWDPEELWHQTGACPTKGQNIRMTLIQLPAAHIKD